MKFPKIGTFQRGREFVVDIVAPSFIAQNKAAGAPVTAIYDLSLWDVNRLHHSCSNLKNTLFLPKLLEATESYTHGI